MWTVVRYDPLRRRSAGMISRDTGRFVRSPEVRIDWYDHPWCGVEPYTPLQHCASRGRPRGCRLPAQSSSMSCRCPTVFHISSLVVASWRIAIGEAYSASANILVVLRRQLGVGIHFVIAVPMAPHRKILN
ncbi:unnamed protein product, partial [Musa banksii]